MPEGGRCKHIWSKSAQKEVQCELPVELITVQQGRRAVYFTISGVEEVMSVNRG